MFAGILQWGSILSGASASVAPKTATAQATRYVTTIHKLTVECLESEVLHLVASYFVVLILDAAS